MAKRNRRRRKANRAGSEGQIELPGTAVEGAGTPAEESFVLEPPPEGSGVEAEGSAELPPVPEEDRQAPSPSRGHASPAGDAAAGDPRPEAQTSEVSHAPTTPSTTSFGWERPKGPARPEAGPALSVEALIAAGEYRRAIPLLETSLEERPEDVQLLVRSGRVFTAVGDYDRAQGVFHQAMELAPDDLSVRKEAGIAMYRRGLYGEAAELLAVVCARSERDGEAYFYRGEALNRSGQSEEAARAMEKASALLPDDERPLMSLGRIFDRLGMVEEAGQMYGRVRALTRKRAAAEDA